MFVDFYKYSYLAIDFIEKILYLKNYNFYFHFLKIVFKV